MLCSAVDRMLERVLDIDSIESDRFASCNSSLEAINKAGWDAYSSQCETLESQIVFFLYNDVHHCIKLLSFCRVASGQLKGDASIVETI